MKEILEQSTCSHNSNLVRDVQSVSLGSNDDVGLLETVGSVEGVDLGDLEVVEVLAGLLDQWFVGSSVDDEHEGVVVLNGLDGALGGQGVLDDGVLVPGLLLLNTLALVLGLSGQLQSLGSSEGGLGPHLVLSDGVLALLDSSGGGLRLSTLIRLKFMDIPLA